MSGARGGAAWAAHCQRDHAVRLARSLTPRAWASVAASNTGYWCSTARTRRAAAPARTPVSLASQEVGSREVSVPGQEGRFVRDEPALLHRAAAMMAPWL